MGLVTLMGVAISVCLIQGRIQDFGKGGGGLINIFTTGGGMPPPVTARGSGGALIAPPVGSGASPQPLFCFFAFI